jgi:hypothetical protein
MDKLTRKPLFMQEIKICARFAKSTFASRESALPVILENDVEHRERYVGRGKPVWAAGCISCLWRSIRVKLALWWHGASKPCVR